MRERFGMFVHKYLPILEVMTLVLVAAILSFCMCGCRAVVPFEGTGIGRAWDQAWFGTPPEVVSAVQFLDRRMREELQAKYEAIEQASVVDPNTGQVVQAWAESRFRDLETTHAELEQWDALSKALAAYVGADLSGEVSQSQAEADKRRKEFWGAILNALRNTQDGKDK